MVVWVCGEAPVGDLVGGKPSSKRQKGTKKVDKSRQNPGYTSANSNFAIFSSEVETGQGL
jgi:hypothetical protein